MKNYLPLVILLAAHLGGLEAVRCYSCSTEHQDQSWCGVNFRPAFVETTVECEHGNCYKFQAEYYDRGARKVVVSRGCIEERTGCNNRVHLGQSGYMCICNKNFCNGGQHIAPALATVLAGLAFVYLQVR